MDSELGSARLLPTVFLNSPQDWSKWYQKIQSAAESEFLWEYINPDTSEELILPPAPQDPGEPRHARTDAEQKILEQERSEYVKNYNQWYQYKQDHYQHNMRLRAFAKYIDNSIAKRYAIRTERKVEARDKLRVLREVAWPGKWFEKYYATKGLNRLLDADLSTRDLEDWLEEVDEAFMMAHQLGGINSVRACQYELILAIKDQLPELYAQQIAGYTGRKINDEISRDQFLETTAEIRTFVSQREAKPTLEEALKASALNEPSEVASQADSKSSSRKGVAESKKKQHKTAQAASAKCIWCEKRHQEANTPTSDHWLYCFYTLPFQNRRGVPLDKETKAAVQQKLQNEPQVQQQISIILTEINDAYE